ncbi:hypothetical protein SCHPADRAFT_211776 [Schizopora paradoxa]|uniref:Uncharacterized protein n=1 Tax=Schizopora paradoxa TaxID=27342 RepID=A0A0H2RWX8_9AGAM|nr:hypothetical protein SCHPADRAFT_211776 [Schizopora paradoxa]
MQIRKQEQNFQVEQHEKEEDREKSKVQNIHTPFTIMNICVCRRSTHARPSPMSAHHTPHSCPASVSMPCHHHRLFICSRTCDSASAQRISHILVVRITRSAALPFTRPSPFRGRLGE